MAAWGYDLIFSCWKYLSVVRLAHSWEILSALEDNIRIPARPCNILYFSSLGTTKQLKKKIGTAKVKFREIKSLLSGAPREREGRSPIAK